MCDDLTAADNADFLMTRREFGAGAAAAGVVALLPVPANAAEIKGRDVTIVTPDGSCDAYFVAPAKGKHPAVIVWPDIFGLRPAFRQMADRLAQSGYAVLTVNQFYRSTKTPFVTPGQGFDDALKAKVGPWRALLTNEAAQRDAAAFIAWVDGQKEVDRKRGIGTTGYCMGGPLVMLTAAVSPARVRGAATFHGGGLAADGLLALVPTMKARFLIAIAENDDGRAPGDKDKLRAAFAAAKLPAEIEVYKGTMHGWCPPDSQVYNAAEANRAWDRLLATFVTL
ncbi:dienelactone hydrolase family protein [Sphingomonas sp. NIBR02145]|uniref:dienelactone hydrolase family protein n=1 Tax=Sphingomonas sp. NIBR02145 TaxID=3014784 RepID=UPI0022B5D10A|nr:dienelactone hydrolase family protein [Sphingomonas sp. NIBR02145]WHU02725.1 dienelactone hydrolase family protein [Sphingomonas sp. NIBR02145]